MEEELICLVLVAVGNTIQNFRIKLLYYKTVSNISVKIIWLVQLNKITNCFLQYRLDFRKALDSKLLQAVYITQASVGQVGGLNHEYNLFLEKTMFYAAHLKQL